MEDLLYNSKNIRTVESKHNRKCQKRIILRLLATILFSIELIHFHQKQLKVYINKKITSTNNRIMIAIVD